MELLAEQKEALNVTLSKDVRNDHAQRVFALTEILRWADKTRKVHQTAVQSDRQRKEAKGVPTASAL